MNGYLLQRFLFSTDWHTGTRARVFVEMQSGSSEPVAAEPVRLHRIRPRVKQFPVTGAAKHERWNLRDIVPVSSHAGVVLAADTNNL